jgi:hypothetical protein
MSEENQRDVPSRDWQWDHREFEGGASYSGVQTSQDGLLWYTEYSPGWAGGGSSEQSFEEFLAHGPKVDCPPEVEAELRALLLLHLGRRNAE